MATNNPAASLLAFTGQQPPVTIGQALLGGGALGGPFGNPLMGGFAVPGPALGTPEGNVEGMMLGLLGESSVSQGMMMNFINEMFTSYDQLAKSYLGMLGGAAAGAGAAAAKE